MVEHRPVKAIVVGSNPTSGAIELMFKDFFGGLFVLYLLCCKYE